MANSLFYALATLAALIFLAGLVPHLRRWLNGQAETGQGGTRRARRSLREVSRALARRQTWRLFLRGGVFQTQIWRESRLRWLMHVGLSWGFVELLFATTTDLLARHDLIPLTKDTPWFALANEIGGMLLLLGVVLALYRRLISRPQHLYTEVQDVVILLWLLLLVLGGYLTEAARLSVSNTPPLVAQWSLIGYGLNRGLSAVGVEPGALLVVAWWTHALAALGLIAALPYTKLLHTLAAPLTVTMDTSKSTPETIAHVPAGWVPPAHRAHLAEITASRGDRASSGIVPLSARGNR
jgi:nitrate reductase gamma subunit